MEILIAVLGIAFLVIGILIYSSLSWGYVLLQFYTWFVLPVFTTLPTINYWQAVGLMFFVGLFCRYSGEGVKREYKDELNNVINMIILPWITLLFGYIINQWFIV